MDQYPVLFPAISNRESWEQIITLTDDSTGDLLALTDSNNNPLYNITCEIQEHGLEGPSGWWPGVPGTYYDDGGGVIIDATLANYITITGLGTIQILIPKSVMQTLRGPRTYDVYVTIDLIGADDGRQLLVGRLPVLYGGRNT